MNAYATLEATITLCNFMGMTRPRNLFPSFHTRCERSSIQLHLIFKSEQTIKTERNIFKHLSIFYLSKIKKRY